MIAISEDIVVPWPSAIVWRLICDPNVVVTCIEGASLGQQDPDGSYEATLAVKFGPIRTKFAARVSLEVDETSRVGAVKATGRDGIGGTKAKSSATFTVVERDPGETCVLMRGDVELSGKLASIIEAGASVVVKRMAEAFAEAFKQRCADAAAEG